MFFVEWWNSLSLAGQIFTCIATPFTLVLIIQTIMLFIGIGSDAMGGGDVDGVDGADVGDDLPDDAPAFEDDLPTESELNGFDGLKIFTVRGIVAFMVVFGWLGLVLDNAGVELYITVPVAALAGIVMMFLLALLFKAAMKLRSEGNEDNRNAIGMSGRVYLTIPPSRNGSGKVNIMLQGSFVERDAVTDDPEPIPTGSEVVVVAVSGQTDLVVKRK